MNWREILEILESNSEKVHAKGSKNADICLSIFKTEFPRKTYVKLPKYGEKA